ncbi:hypothetical protein C0Z01_18540 [Photobacterium kishitanii]|uniref:Uncharacterized protein n=1 Tax=Photobacterium kishitanii TaxID=318456 RepID=A0A0B7JD13_9GAMM|nr:hypothetical protein [Photobacterium kishitanii]OBU27316.1 hypothetical protein AYY22_03515 [Photobacterium kishitanii]PSU86475.1 hypothetical protein C0W42_20675 [Photobacterium kishitanii]PSU99952.1 hypothetical protein C9J27_06820 [Photobacterium kishitanii]PSV09302.1 hypothetical protein C0W28_20295 [Photobacterium kishitanii]PSW67851.1 hypothetical protein C0Z01_18540 [Photobacterium kishitanii]
MISRNTVIKIILGLLFVVLFTIVAKESQELVLKSYSNAPLASGYTYVDTDLDSKEIVIKTIYKKRYSDLRGTVVDIAIPSTRPTYHLDNLSEYPWGDESKGEITLF